MNELNNKKTVTSMYNAAGGSQFSLPVMMTFWMR